MKKILFIYLITILTIYSQSTNIELYKFEYGHFNNNQPIKDTTINTCLKTELNDNQIIINSKTKQIYNLNELLDSHIDIYDKVKMLSYYSTDQDNDYCNVIIYLSNKLNYININYNNCWVKYYFN